MKKSVIAEPPNCPGGKLMQWITSVSGGQLLAVKCGEGSGSADWSQWFNMGIRLKEKPKHRRLRN